MSNNDANIAMSLIVHNVHKVHTVHSTILSNLIDLKEIVINDANIAISLGTKRHKVSKLQIAITAI